MPMRISWVVIAAVGMALLGPSTIANAQFETVQLSSDTTIDIGPSTISDEEMLLVSLDYLFLQFPLALPEVAPAADVNGYHALDASGAVLLSFASDVALPGGLVASGADVVRADNGVSIELAGHSEGIPRGSSSMRCRNRETICCFRSTARLRFREGSLRRTKTS